MICIRSNHVLTHFFCRAFFCSATIVIHCASGKRAFKAQEILESEGYTNVLNAGTFANMKEILGQ